MIKIIFSILIFLILIFSPRDIFAQTNSFVSVVNPVRGEDFWELKDQKIDAAVIGQAEILSTFNVQATWLLRFDALNNKEVLDVVNTRLQDEKGLFLEVTPSWANEAGVNYNESDNWHDAGSAFLSGYELKEREKLIDTSFRQFKEIFGHFPKSVGAWWVDAYSLDYMQKKYGILSSLIVADQYTTDNYQIWGQYFQAPYYPSKNHALHPAKSTSNKIPVVMVQWASRDPINGYGGGVGESTFSVQANDYINYHNLDTNYFTSLLDIYTKQKLNKFGHIVVGLENSYDWGKYSKEYENQIRIISQRQSSADLLVTTLSQFATWYINTFPNLSPQHLIVADDPLGSKKKVVWFMNPYYRAGWFFNEEESVFRDIRQYVEGEEELCFQKRCNEINFATFATRVLDNVSFGHKLVIDEGNINDFKVEKISEKIVLSYKNEAGGERVIEFLLKDIGIDGRITSIDETILKATQSLTTEGKTLFLEKGSFSWSLGSVILKIIKFAIFLILACFVPGYVITRRFFISLILGIILTTLLFYIFSLLNLRFLILVYIALTLIIFIRLRLFKNLKLQRLKFERWGVLPFVLIVIGTIFQSIPTFKNGLVYPFGYGFWGPNTHDGVWHISLINQLVKGVPAQNPIFAGDALKNYHFFYDLLIAATTYFSAIPVWDLVFRFYPILFSLGLGIGTYYLSLNLFKDRLAALFSLYLVYFGGSFGWIVEYLRERHLGGESAFWANQSISFNLNPPFAISLIIIIAIFQILLNQKITKVNFFLLTILSGTLISFKAYGGVLLLATLFTVSVVKKSLPHFSLFISSTITSILLFLSNFSSLSSILIFSPFWFIHSMVDSLDRVGWVRLSLARTAGLEQGNWFKFLTAEAIGLTIFLVGNLGTRAFALLALLKIKNIVRRQDFLFLFVFSSLSVIIPTLFIQAGNPWNTIQFLYYGLYVSSIVAGVVISKICLKVNRKIATILVLSIFAITPINSWATANGYLSYNPHAYVSNPELEALRFLESKEDGTVLTYPYDKNLRQKIAEPWPLFAYDSTSYVSAFSKKSVFIEDEGQNQILLTDYKESGALKKRVVASKDFFSKKDIKTSGDFLKSNNIKYIYLPKIYRLNLDQERLPIKQIFENSENLIYEVIN